MSKKTRWSKVQYNKLPHSFSTYNGIVSPCNRYYVSTRIIGSSYNAQNWAVLDLITLDYKDGFRFRREAIAFVESL